MNYTLILLIVIIIIVVFLLIYKKRRKNNEYYKAMFNFIKNNPPTIYSSSITDGPEYDLGKELVKQREETGEYVINEEGKLEQTGKKNDFVENTLDKVDDIVDNIPGAKYAPGYILGKEYIKGYYKVGKTVVKTIAKLAEKIGCVLMKCKRPEYADYITFGSADPIVTTYIQNIMNLICVSSPVNVNNYSFPMLLSDFNQVFSNMIFYYKIYINSSLTYEDKKNIFASICLITIAANLNYNFMIEGFGSAINTAKQLENITPEQKLNNETNLSQITIITPEVMKFALKIFQKEEIDYVSYEEFKTLIVDILEHIFDISKFLDISITKYKNVTDLPKTEKINIIIYMTVLYGLMFEYNSSNTQKVRESLKKMVPDITDSEMKTALSSIEQLYNTNRDASLSSIFDVCKLPIYSNFFNCHQNKASPGTSVVDEFMKKDTPCSKYVTKN